MLLHYTKYSLQLSLFEISLNMGKADFLLF